jgi:CHAD domain-containing protein
VSAKRRQPSVAPDHELELKYVVVDAAAVKAFVDTNFPPTAGETWREYSTVDRVFDTADGLLLRAGYGARLRRTGGLTIVGVKSDVTVDGGLHLRRELEAEATARLAPADWPPSEVRDLVVHLADGQALRERYVLRQRRHERAWRADGGECLFSLDVVRVVHRRVELAELTQLEVELRAGDPRLLRSIDEALAGSGLVRHEQRSKLAIAAELVELAAPLRADDSFADAGRHVLRRHLVRMLEREQAARLGDELALKQMRVATRRMRATWRLFEGAYRGADQRRYVRELRRIARRLGAVRDLDVLLAGLPAEQHLAPLAEAWRERRASAWRQLLRTLDSTSYADFVADYRRFTQTPGLAAGSQAELRLRDVVGSRLWSAYERVRRHAPALENPTVATLHALRIDGKRLRYALETFRDVLPPKATAELIERLTAMQDHLGALNDRDVAQREAAAWLAAQSTVSRPVGRAVRAHVRGQDAEIARLRSSFAPLWRRVGGPSFRRRLALAIADLG